MTCESILTILLVTASKRLVLLIYNFLVRYVRVLSVEAARELKQLNKTRGSGVYARGEPGAVHRGCPT